MALVFLVALLSCASAWKAAVPPLECRPDHCDVVFPATDYSPFVGYAFYVRVRLFLKMSPEDEDQKDQVSLTLSGAELSKEQGAAPGPGALPLGAFAIFLLKSATTFRAKVSYGKGAVVGRAKDLCPRNNRSLSCLEDVQIGQELFESDTSKFTAYDARYWRRLVARHVDELGASDLRLDVQLQRDDRLDARYYVNPLLQGAPLAELSLRDVADIQAVDLGRQGALLNLSVSGVPVGDYQGLLGGAPGLRSLTLSRVNLTLPPLAPFLSRLERLEALDVSGNPLVAAAPLAAALPASVTSLSVADCPSVTTLAPLLRRLPSLRRLDAGGCSLRTLEGLEAAPLLERLDVSRNGLSAVPDAAFAPLAALRSLDLSGNALSAVALRLHPGAATLEALDLHGNLLESPARLLGGGGVATLNLSGNPLAVWDDADAFRPWLAGGGVLDLSRCRVAFLSAPMRASLAGLPAPVLLDGNPLDCNSCLIGELRGWLNSSQGAALAGSLKCARPPALAGRLVVAAPGEGECPDDDGDAGRPPVNLYAVLLPLGAVLLALGAAVGGAGYVYRYEITYIKHLVKLRRGRQRGGGGGAFRYDAFVCYSGDDRNWVMRKLLPSLENGPGSYRLCLHERDFVLGSIIARNIVSFMQESRNTIVVLTESFVKSQWCQWELDMANHKVFADDRDFLIFVELERLERRALPRHLRYLMDTRTYLEWPSPSADVDEEALWRRLRTAMGPSIATSNVNTVGAAVATTTASSA